MRQTEFFILGYFLHFYLPNNPENQNFEKMKKTAGDIILYDDIWCMIPEIWSVKDSFFSDFAPFFALSPPPPPPLTTQRIKILKNEKKPLEISSFYHSVP